MIAAIQRFPSTIKIISMFMCLLFLPISGILAVELKEDPPERMLANIEANKRVSDDDPRIAKIRAGLVRADQIYNEDAEKIANLTFHCWNRVKEDAHQSVSMTEILTGSTQWQSPAYFKAGVAREYAEYIAVYMTVRVDIAKKEGKSLSHKETIASMREITDSLIPPSDSKR